MKLKSIIQFIIVNAPKIKYYASLVIQVLESVDGVKDWHNNNAPAEVLKTKK